MPVPATLPAPRPGQDDDELDVVAVDDDAGVVLEPLELGVSLLDDEELELSPPEPSLEELVELDGEAVRDDEPRLSVL
jgi:hypothetical protein